MIYALEQLQDDEWINVGYGEFDSLEDAMEDTSEFSNNMSVSLSELRVKAIDKIPEGILRNCKCGGRLLFTADCRTICELCLIVNEIGENE